jgi:hypothetical protein
MQAADFLRDGEIGGRAWAPGFLFAVELTRFTGKPSLSLSQ